MTNVILIGKKRKDVFIALLLMIAVSTILHTTLMNGDDKQGDTVRVRDGKLSEMIDRKSLILQENVNSSEYKKSSNLDESVVDVNITSFFQGNTTLQKKQEIEVNRQTKRVFDNKTEIQTSFLNGTVDLFSNISNEVDHFEPQIRSGATPFSQESRQEGEREFALFSSNGWEGYSTSKWLVNQPLGVDATISLDFLFRSTNTNQTSFLPLISFYFAINNSQYGSIILYPHKNPIRPDTPNYGTENSSLSGTFVFDTFSDEDVWYHIEIPISMFEKFNLIPTRWIDMAVFYLQKGETSYNIAQIGIDNVKLTVQANATEVKSSVQKRMGTNQSSEGCEYSVLLTDEWNRSIRGNVSVSYFYEVPLNVSSIEWVDRKSGEEIRLRINFTSYLEGINSTFRVASPWTIHNISTEPNKIMSGEYEVYNTSTEVLWIIVKGENAVETIQGRDIQSRLLDITINTKIDQGEAEYFITNGINTTILHLEEEIINSSFHINSRLDEIQQPGNYTLSIIVKSGNNRLALGYSEWDFILGNYELAASIEAPKDVKEWEVFGVSLTFFGVYIDEVPLVINSILLNESHQEIMLHNDLNGNGTISLTAPFAVGKAVWRIDVRSELHEQTSFFVNAQVIPSEPSLVIQERFEDGRIYMSVLPSVMNRSISAEVQIMYDQLEWTHEISEVVPEVNIIFEVKEDKLLNFRIKYGNKEFAYVYEFEIPEVPGLMVDSRGLSTNLLYLNENVTITYDLYYPNQGNSWFTSVKTEMLPIWNAYIIREGRRYTAEVTNDFITWKIDANNTTLDKLEIVSSKLQANTSVVMMDNQIQGVIEFFEVDREFHNVSVKIPVLGASNYDWIMEGGVDGELMLVTTNQSLIISNIIVHKGEFLILKVTGEAKLAQENGSDHFLQPVTLGALGAIPTIAVMLIWKRARGRINAKIVL